MGYLGPALITAWIYSLRHWNARTRLSPSVFTSLGAERGWHSGAGIDNMVLIITVLSVTLVTWWCQASGRFSCFVGAVLGLSMNAYP